MKKEKFLPHVPALMLVLGGVCFALRIRLYAVALDAKGLLLRGHPLERGIWITVAVAAVLAVLAARAQKRSDRYEENFAPSAVAALGHFLLAAGIGATVLTCAPGAFGTLGTVWKVLGLLAAPLLLWAGFCRIRGTVPLFLSYGAVCLFLLVHVMSQYQHWCSNPQLMDYVFALLGNVAMAFFAYYTAAFAAGCANPRMYLISGLLTVLLCAGALSGGTYPLLYLGGLVWALTDLSRLLPPPEEEDSAYDAA